MPIAPGFDSQEASAFLGMACAIEPPEVSGLPPAPIPPCWVKVFQSKEIGPYNNMWALYKDPPDGAALRYALVLRGTVGKLPSIVEDILALTVPATGSIETESGLFDYKLASDPRAGVHYGFLIGMLYLMYDDSDGILKKLGSLVGETADMFIVGHSQGAALATLLRSYLHYTQHFPPEKRSYKTYLFAQPKPGNDYYAYDFEGVVNPPGMAFRVTNTLDWVPQVPFTIQLLSTMNVVTLVGPVQRAAQTLMSLVSRLIQFLANFRSRRRFRKHARGLSKLSYVQNAARSKGERKPREAGDAGGEHPGLRFVGGFNYVNCGQQVVLQGNYQPKADDLMWQHHAQMYFHLLSPGNKPPGPAGRAPTSAT
jgi:hypothetical protein